VIQAPVVAATVGYNAGTRTVTLTPNASLKSAMTYSAVLKGGASGVVSLTGARLPSDYVWNFTTDIYGDGPGGPILVVTQPTNGFSRYYAEVLLAEGINAFAMTNVSALSAAVLGNYDVVLLAETGLSAAQVSVLADWGQGVRGGARSHRGKSGLRRAGCWRRPVGATRRKVPQKTDRSRSRG